MGISQEPTEPVMGNQDPDQLHETILTLTLEIIYLLTGEDYSVTKKKKKKKSGDDMPLPQSCTDCMLGGACSPTVAPPPGSVIEKENAKKILELMSNIIQLLTGEVAIRCEDVSLYFSLEEWQYLKGNKTRYREVIKENWEQLRPLGCEWDVGADVCNANKPDKTEAEEADSWGEGNPPNPEISPTDPQTLTNCISHGIKEESWEVEEHCEWNTDPPTEQIQGTDPPTDTVGSHLNISQSDNDSDIKGALYSWGEGNPPTPEISPTDPQTLTHCISHGIKEESASCEEGEDLGSSRNPPTEQFQGTDPPTDTVEAIDQSGRGYGEPLLWELREHSDSNVKRIKKRIKRTIPPGELMPSSLNESSSGNYVSTGMKAEPVSREDSDCSIVFPLVQRQVNKTSADLGSNVKGGLLANYISDDITEEPCSWNEDSSTSIEHQATDIIGLKHGAAGYLSIMRGAASRDKRAPPNTDISIADHLPDCLSNCSNGEASRWEIEGEHSDFNSNTRTEQPRGTELSADTMGTSLTDSLLGENCTEYNKVIDSASPMQAEVQSFTCYECGKCFVSQRDLFKHLRIHTGKKTFLCCKCGMCFVHQIDLHRHMKSHKGDRPFSCSVCRKRFHSKSDCNRHRIIHTGEKPFACSECGRRFGFLSSLRRHFSLHMRKEQFSCVHCGECFVLQTHLNNHLRIHVTKKSCSECGKCFAREIGLHRHSTTHAGRKQLSCSECGKDFGFESDLHRHLRTHKEKKVLSCPECGRGFECESDLSRHLRIHDEKKLLSCSHCGKNFQCQSELKRHFRIHTGEKPFSCSKCGRCFGFVSSLRRHCRTHFKKAVDI